MANYHKRQEKRLYRMLLKCHVLPEASIVSLLTREKADKYSTC